MRMLAVFRHAALAALTAFGAAAAGLSGAYVGIDAAAGMRLEFEPQGERLDGVLTGFADRPLSFSASRVGEVAEAVVETGSGRLFLRAAPQPIGAMLALTPMTPAGGLEPGEARAYAFIREGVALPDAPERYLPPPEGPVPAIEAAAFVSSYPFWTPREAGWGYAALAARDRAVIRLFPLVQTDILWKLCAAEQRGGALAEALDGQGVDCAAVLEGVRAAQRGDGFDRFKRDVAAERATLMTVFGCAGHLWRNRPECARASAETARRAVSMETAASLLPRYR